MSAESTQPRHQADQGNASEATPSPAEIVRAFGVVLGPALLLDLFAALSTLAVLRGRASRPRGRLVRLRRTLTIPGATFPWVYALVLRPWHLRWGATDEEVGKPLPGDEMVPDPAIESTRAITVNAPVEEVWSWLAQIGQDRGGFYSYTTG